MVWLLASGTLPNMEISSTSSSAQATEIQQALILKKTINAEQRKVLALIESAIPASDSQDSAKVGKMLDAKA
jgi:hypothetical protein